MVAKLKKKNAPPYPLFFYLTTSLPSNPRPYSLYFSLHHPPIPHLLLPTQYPPKHLTEIFPSLLPFLLPSSPPLYSSSILIPPFFIHSIRIGSKLTHFLPLSIFFHFLFFLFFLIFSFLSFPHYSWNTTHSVIVEHQLLIRNLHSSLPLPA